MLTRPVVESAMSNTNLTQGTAQHSGRQNQSNNNENITLRQRVRELEQQVKQHRTPNITELDNAGSLNHHPKTRSAPEGTYRAHHPNPRYARIHDKHYATSKHLPNTINAITRHRADPFGNKHSFTVYEYKLLGYNSNFNPTQDIYLNVDGYSMQKR